MQAAGTTMDRTLGSEPSHQSRISCLHAGDQCPGRGGHGKVRRSLVVRDNANDHVQVGPIGPTAKLARELFREPCALVIWLVAVHEGLLGVLCSNG